MPKKTTKMSEQAREAAEKMKKHARKISSEIVKNHPLIGDDGFLVRQIEDAINAAYEQGKADHNEMINQDI